MFCGRHVQLVAQSSSRYTCWILRTKRFARPSRLTVTCVCHLSRLDFLALVCLFLIFLATVGPVSGLLCFFRRAKPHLFCRPKPDQLTQNDGSVSCCCPMRAHAHGSLPIFRLDVRCMIEQPTLAVIAALWFVVPKSENASRLSQDVVWDYGAWVCTHYSTGESRWHV